MWWQWALASPFLSVAATLLLTGQLKFEHVDVASMSIALTGPTQSLQMRFRRTMVFVAAALAECARLKVDR